MKKLLNWQSKEVVNIFDEVTLWSAPFGRLLLENIPMRPKSKIVDIGFGTGFPLIELSQRFGKDAQIYGIDIWEEAIKRTKEKIATLEIKNIKIIENTASEIPINSDEIDLVTSNLGINNFDAKSLVYAEVYRILKKGGQLCLTTNPIGTFKELFDLFHTVLLELELEKEIRKLTNYIHHRNTAEGIIAELEESGFVLVKQQTATTRMRFVSGKALLNHSLIRIGFREYWENMISEQDVDLFFDRLIQKIDAIVQSKGEFSMTIPMLYLEFEKP